MPWVMLALQPPAPPLMDGQTFAAIMGITWTAIGAAFLFAGWVYLQFGGRMAKHDSQHDEIVIRLTRIAIVVDPLLHGIETYVSRSLPSILDPPNPLSDDERAAWAEYMLIGAGSADTKTLLVLEPALRRELQVPSLTPDQNLVFTLMHSAIVARLSMRKLDGEDIPDWAQTSEGL